MQVNFNQNSFNSFKGNFAKTDEGNVYYKTNTATKTGLTLGSISLIGSMLYKPFIKLGENSLKKLNQNSEKIKIDSVGRDEFFKIPAKNIAVAGAITFILHTACGYLTDYFRNKKSAEAADDIKNLGLKKALNKNENIELSENRKPYYNSNLGAKVGIGLGAIFSTVYHYARFGLFKNFEAFKPKGYTLIPDIIVGAIGGAILGAITDNISNKQNKKHA